MHDQQLGWLFVIVLLLVLLLGGDKDKPTPLGERDDGIEQSMAAAA